MILTLNEACTQIIQNNKRLSKPFLKSLTDNQDHLYLINLYGSVRFAWHWVNNTWSIPACSVCNKPTKWLDARRRYGLTCSKVCSNQDPNRQAKREKTILEKYGVTNISQSPEIKQKKRDTTLKHYGVEYPAQSKTVLDKQQQTTLDRYGVAHAMQSKDVRAKQQNTMVEKYGVKNASHSETLQNKKKETCFEKYGSEYAYGSNIVRGKITESMLERWGVINPSQHPDIQAKKVNTFLERYGVTSATYIGRDQKTIEILTDKNKFIDFITDKTIKETAELLDVNVVTIFAKSKIYQCGDLFRYDFDGSSSYEKIIIELLNSYNIQYQLHNRKIIHPHELDIFIPDYNLAIEVGSAFWHGEQNEKYETYHLDKWKKCKNNGITLLQFFDDDIFAYWHLTKSKILRCLNLSIAEIIGARKLTISKPSRVEEQSFLNEWHTKGYAAVRYDSIGGYYNNELMGILTFKKTSDPMIVKIDRWSTNVNYSFPGLFSRLLSHWIKKENFKGTIETWCDNRLGDGKVYKSAGFIEKDVSTPGYWYFKNNGLENRINYQRHKLQKIFNLSEEENRKELTEYDIMLNQGYDRLWDAGHTKWVKEIK